MKNDDLITDTPVKNSVQKGDGTYQSLPIWYNKNIEIFKIIQRVIMVILTVIMIISLVKLGNNILIMREELQKARIGIDTMKIEISRLTDEINKGIKIRFW